MSSDAKPVIHRGVSLMVCDNKAILEETLQSIELSDVNMQRIGSRAIAAPAYQLEKIRNALQDSGTYPKVTGNIVSPSRLEETSDDEDHEGQADADEE